MLKKEIKFSIIIPCYNVEKYIERTILSVLNQSYKNFEILLINDGSNDNTLNIIENFQKKDLRIKIFSQENKGVSATRNKGVKESKGEYILFLDGDDLIENNLLEEARVKIIENNVEVFSFGYEVYWLKRKKIYRNMNLRKKILSSHSFLKLFLQHRINQSICSFIVKKDLIKDLDFKENLTTGEDLDFQLRLLLKKFNIYYDDYPYFKYIKRENSATTKKGIPLKNLDTLEELENLRRAFLEKQIIDFNNYHIIRFFNIIRGIAKNGIENNEILRAEDILKKHDYILNELKFKNNKIVIKLCVLTIIYKINKKFLMQLFKFCG